MLTEGDMLRRVSGLILSMVVIASVIGSAGSSYAASGPTPVPTKFVGGYLENWISTLPRSVPAGYGLLFSAFATINANGSVSYAPSQNAASFKADVAARNAAGKPTILSVGGAGGAQSGLRTAAQQVAFLSSVQSVIDAYGFSGIDWDIESGVAISVSGLASVSRSLVAHYGPTFAITMAPYGETEATFKQLARSIRDILTFVGFQFYNDNAAPNPVSVLGRMDAWIRDTGIAPSQFSIGFMSTDDGGLVTPYSSMVNIYNAVNVKYPAVRGVWDWAVGLDQDSGYRFVNTFAPLVGSRAPSPVPATVPGTYTVVPGDTFNIIAVKLGISSAALQAANLGIAPASLWVGQVLRLPAPGPAPRLYSVLSGDTFNIIAVKLGISSAALQAANLGIAPASLWVGQVLRLPAPGPAPSLYSVLSG